MRKMLVFVLVLLMCIALVGCAEQPFTDDPPDQDISQDVDDSEQSGSEDLEEDSSTDESEDTVPSGPIGTPVPPIQNGGDYEFN